MIILDSNGNVVVEYLYNAWGQEVGRGGTMWQSLGTLNPFRYRGYYFDQESGLYLTGTRYYDPEISRWINPEPNVYQGDYDDGAGLFEHNIYSYCANNPTNYYDPTGEFILTAIVVGVVAGAVVGGAIGGIVAYNSAKETGKTGSDLFWATAGGVGKGAVMGGVGGGLIGVTAGVVAVYGAGSVAGTAMISGTLTVSARATEVTALQIKKSTSEGKSGWQTANNCVDSVFNNGGKIVGFTPVTKAGGISSKYIYTDLSKHKVVPLKFNTFLKSTSRKSLPYGFAIYNWGHTTYSILSNDPMLRALQRGYALR